MPETGRVPVATNDCFVDVELERGRSEPRAALEKTDGRVWVESDPSDPRGAVVQSDPDDVWRRPQRVGPSRLHGHWLCQQYPCKRPLVATTGARLNDCKVSETVSSKAGGDRLLTLHTSRMAHQFGRRRCSGKPALRPPDRLIGRIGMRCGRSIRSRRCRLWCRTPGPRSMTAR